MKNYIVEFEVTSHYSVVVEAENLEEAKEKAESEFSEADFGASENIDGQIELITDDETGEEVYSL